MTLKLENGDYLVLTSNIKFIVDPTFNNSYNFTTDVIGNSVNYENLAYFSKKDGGNIIYITKSKHYFISPNGILIISNSF